jgi:hypothetical protein
MRRTRTAQLVIIAVAIAAAVAILAPAFADRAEERGGARGVEDGSAAHSWPGLGSRAGEKPTGYGIALYGDLALAERFPIPADAVFGPRAGALELTEARNGDARVTPAAADAAGPRFALDAPAGASRLKVVFFGTSAAAPDLASLGAAIQAFESASPGALVVAYASPADLGSQRAQDRADASRKLRRAGAEIVVWHGVAGASEASQNGRRWIFYGLGGTAANAKSLVLRLLVSADDKGDPRAELRAYPLVGQRTATARELGEAYWNLLMESWAPEEHLMKRKIGFGFDDVGRHFSFGKIPIDGRP